MINPWTTNSFLDSCAFDPKYQPEQASPEELFRLQQEEGLPLLIAHSTQKELEHPNTPEWVKKEAAHKIFSVRVQRTPQELRLRRDLLALITGNANPAKHVDDVEHILEAQKYGSYFVTTDRRLLSRADDVRALCGVIILLPSQFVALAKAQ